MRHEDLGEIFHALSDITRLKILELLKKPGKSACDLIYSNEKGLCACDIQDKIGLSQGAISHHMDLLRRAGLVHAEKRGKWMFYWRNESVLARLAQAIAKTV